MYLYKCVDRIQLLFFVSINCIILYNGLTCYVYDEENRDLSNKVYSLYPNEKDLEKQFETDLKREDPYTLVKKAVLLADRNPELKAKLNSIKNELKTKLNDTRELLKKDLATIKGLKAKYPNSKFGEIEKTIETILSGDNLERMVLSRDYNKNSDLAELVSDFKKLSSLITLQLEEKENAKRTADSLKYAAQERARELKEQKAMERENAKRTADSIKVAQKMEKQQSEADKKKSDGSAPQEDVDTSQTPQVEDTALPKEEKDGQSKENPESKSKDDGQSTEKPVTEEKRAEEKKSETKEDHESPEAKPSGENGKSEEGSDNSDDKEKAESGIVKHVGEAKVLVCEKDSRRSLCPFFDANMLKNLNSIGYSSYSGVYLGQIDRNALCAFGDSFSQN